MGGHGSGGSRVGAGRKRKGATVLRLHGGRVRRRQLKSSAPIVSPPTVVTAPADLPAAQATVWADLAPHAIAVRTLVASTVAAFRDLCAAITLKRSMLREIERDGLTYLKVSVDGAGVEHHEVKAHPLISQYRGMMQRVEAGMARFRLAPVGKEIVPIAKPEDPFEEFDLDHA